MVLSEKQKRRLKAQGKHAENRNIVAVRLGLSQGTINSCNTRIFTDFNELLCTLNEYYPVFERRFRNRPESLAMLRSLTRRIRKSRS